MVITVLCCHSSIYIQLIAIVNNKYLKNICIEKQEFMDGDSKSKAKYKENKNQILYGVSIGNVSIYTALIVPSLLLLKILIFTAKA